MYGRRWMLMIAVEEGIGGYEMEISVDNYFLIFDFEEEI